MPDIELDILEEKTLPTGNFLDEVNNKLVKRVIYERIKYKLTSEPTIPVRACDAAIATVVNYLNSLCEFTSMPGRQYSIENIFKLEYLTTKNIQLFQEPFAELLKEVAQFVGKDEWSYYFFKVKGTILIIEKGLDFRIADWHKQQIESSEAFDHDLGGIHDGYELAEPRRSAKIKKY